MSIIDADKKWRSARRRKRKKEFEDVLERQATRLRQRDCPTKIIEGLKDLWPALLDKLMDMILPSDYLVAVPVSPRLVMPFSEQIMMVRNGFLTGYVDNELIVDLIEDIISAPEGPYYMLGVEDGQSTLRQPPCVARVLFKEKKCSGLLAVEIIALAIHSANLLASWKLASTASVYIHPEPTGGKVAALGLDGQSRPALTWTFATVGWSDVGVPSCLQRFF